VLSEFYWGIESEGRYWWLRGIRNLLTVGESIVWSCMVSDPDWSFTGVSNWK